MKAPSKAPHWLSFIGHEAATLFPGYFALVMATGIISIATHLLKMSAISAFLFWCNLLFYAVLLLLFVARLLFYFPRATSDMYDHQKGPGFFTIVAGTCILGTQLFVQTGYEQVATNMFILGAAFWVVIVYTFFTVITIKENKPRIEKGINGSWLIIIVSTQAVATLSTYISTTLENPHILLFFALCMYFVGCILYILFNALIVYRFSFFHFEPTEMGAPYWINVGATAITTLAGSSIMINGQNWTFLADILPFIKGFTLFFWSAGTWWIPLFMILGVWRHVVRKVPLPFSRKGYDPSYWSMVFPLGMYTTCTYRLSEALGLKMLMVIPKYFIFIALAAWVMVFAGLLHQLYGKLFLKN